MTQEDINEVVTKSMPQWKKDQFDAIHANADYIDWLRRRIERLEEKLKSHNSEYVEINGTDWICEKCGQTVDGRNVTFEEIHEGCGGKCH